MNNIVFLKSKFGEKKERKKNQNLAKHQEHAENVWALTLQTAAFWAKMSPFNICQAESFTDTLSCSKHCSRSERGLRSSQVMCVFIGESSPRLNGSFWGRVSIWLAHAQTREEGASERGRDAPCSRKKASQLNYKPEKISVLRHCKQNGFCFLQDNELTRAHHTEQHDQRGRKCCHMRKTMQSFSQGTSITCHCPLNSHWIFTSLKVVGRLLDIFLKSAVWGRAGISQFPESFFSTAHFELGNCRWPWSDPPPPRDVSGRAEENVTDGKTWRISNFLYWK